MAKTKLSILDLTSESKEGMSEGWLLWELMRILGYEKNVDFEYIRGKMHFLQLLNDAKGEYVHIGAHGEVESGRTGLLTPRGVAIKPEDLEGTWKSRKRKPRLVVISACEAGHKDLVNAFTELGVKNVIAPLHDTDWEDAAVFLTMFYKLLISEKKTPWVSYRNAICGYRQAFRKLSGAWRFYKNKEHVQVEC
jgi:hypothetical protein